MTDLTTPAEVDGEIDNTASGNAWEKAGSGSWIVDGVDISGIYSALDTTDVNGFLFTASTGLTATFDGGEAYVGGWLCRDRTTDVTLPASSTTIVYVGYDASAVLASGDAPADNENIIIGPSGDFANEDPKIPVWTFDTDGSSVTSDTDLRQLEQPISSDSSNELQVNAPIQFNDPIQGDIDVQGDVRAVDLVQARDPDGSYGDINLLNSRSFDGLAHYMTTTSPHLPFIIRNSATNTLVCDNGDVDVPVGHLYYQGDATLRVTQDWDGNSMVLESSNGDTIELIRE